MAATRNNPLELEIGDRNEAPVAAGRRLFQGSMAFADAEGRATDVLGAKFLGHVAVEADNRLGGDGAINALLQGGRYRAQVTITGVALTDIGKQVFASDNDALTLDDGAGANALVGRVIRYVATDKAIVEFTPVNYSVATVVQQAHIADFKADYVADDVDTGAETAAVLNTIAAALNTLLAQLEAAGVNASA